MIRSSWFIIIFQIDTRMMGVNRIFWSSQVLNSPLMHSTYLGSIVGIIALATPKFSIFYFPYHLPYIYVTIGKSTYLLSIYYFYQNKHPLLVGLTDEL